MDRKIVIIWGAVVVGLLGANLFYSWILIKGLHHSIIGLAETGVKTLTEINELKKEISRKTKPEGNYKTNNESEEPQAQQQPTLENEGAVQKGSEIVRKEGLKYDSRHWKVENSKLKWIGGGLEWRPDTVAWIYMGTNTPFTIEFKNKKSPQPYPEYHVSAIIYGNGFLPEDQKDPWVQGAILNYSKNQGWLRTNGIYKQKWVQINRKAPKIDSRIEHNCIISYSNNTLTFAVDGQRVVYRDQFEVTSKGSYLGFPVYWNNKLDEYEFSDISINGKKIILESNQSPTNPQQNP
jgi:hypothetical protein